MRVSVERKPTASRFYFLLRLRLTANPRANSPKITAYVAGSGMFIEMYNPSLLSI